MDKSYITFNVRSSSTSKTLGLEVMLDNDVVYSNDSFIAAESIRVELPEDNEHSLKIVLKNKTSDHTVLDPLGAIVQDTNLIISNICFDDIVATHNILQMATYTHDCNGTADQLKQHKFYGEIGCNGTVELKFSTPISLWLLENS